MTAAVGRVRGIFVEARPRAVPAAPARSLPAFPSLVVLCAPVRGRAVAAGVAVALARASGARVALASAAGVGAIAPAAVTVAPAARRAAARLRERGHQASARGRLVWVADRRAAGTRGSHGEDPAGSAGAASAELGRAAASVGTPRALALPLRRCAGLDRVLAWHDGIVVVREPDATDGLTDLVLGSLAALGLPVACVDAPSRVAGAVAMLGLTPPAFAVAAVAQLGITIAPTPDPRA
jgi:hypothetical protein